MTYRQILLTTALIAMSGCAGAALAPEQRQFQIVENTTADAKTAYSRALVHIGKSWGDSNSAIKVKDESGAQIVVKGWIVCNELRQAMDPADYRLSFNLDLQAKDKKVRMSFEDLEMQDKLGKPVPWAYNQISSAEKVAAVKPCVKPLTSALVGAINGGAKENW
jgi:hypothetical protein